MTFKDIIYADVPLVPVIAYGWASRKGRIIMCTLLFDFSVFTIILKIFFTKYLPIVNNMIT